MSEAKPVNPLTIGSWWRAHVRTPDGHIGKVVTVGSYAHPNGSHVTLDEADATTQIGSDAAIAVCLDADGRATHFEHQPHLVPKAPPLWWVEVAESAAQPPATNLIAFTGDTRPEGDLVHEADVGQFGISGDDQVAAIRWLPATGRVDQIYVQPDYRRRGISSALIGAAGVLAAARGWPELWGDGQRTELGEAMVRGVAWSDNAAELTHLRPPMTPGEDQG